MLIEPVIPAEVIARVRAAARTKTLQEELVGQYRRLETMLHEDPLTGLFNRRYVLTRLAGLISGARRHGRPLSVAMIDIDHFKPSTTRYGHDAGDAALVAITIALRDRLRAEDELGRLGGEEFLALLPDAGDDAAAVVAESLRASVEGVRTRSRASSWPSRSASAGRRGTARRTPTRSSSAPTGRSSWPSERGATRCGGRRTLSASLPRRT